MVVSNTQMQMKGKMNKLCLAVVELRKNQDLIMPQVYKFRKHVNAPVIKIIEGLIEKKHKPN